MSDVNGRKVAVLVVAAALASAILICPASACAVPFSDVSGGEYYSEAAYWLGRAGIFAGDEEGRLNAGAVFSRAHMAVVLARITGQEGLTEVLSTHQTGWVDDVLIPPWARGAFALAEARGWFVGRADGTVAPDVPLTWAEIAMLLVRITDNEHLLSGEWPQSAVDAARAMGAFSGLPEGPVPDLPVLRGQVVVVIWAAVRTPTRLGLSDEGESLLSLHHSAIAEVYRLRDRDESGGSLTVEAALSDRAGGVEVIFLLDGERFSAPTDPEGRVRHTFPDLSPGRCAVRVEAEGYHSSSRTVDIEPGGHVRFDGIVLQAEGEMFTAEEVAERALPATVTVIDGGGSLGSGFHIGDEMVVTNYHVIEGGVGLSVRAHDGEQYPVGGVAAADVDCDLAVLVVPGLEIPHLELSDDGQVRAGQTVVAVGSPLGLAGTVSAGIVSAPSREVLGQSFIQTTAPISPGSSGSPLLDLYGRVVGVITMAAVDPAVQTINFAIPSSRVIELVEGAGAAEDLPGAEDSSAEVLSVGELDAWLAEVTGDTLFEFSLVTAAEDGDAIFFYLWVRAGDDCQQLLGITATEEGTSTVEQLLREIAGFIFANTQRPTAGTIVCWDRWRYYPQVLADAGWEVYGEPGDWISSRSLVWVYLWEADDCLVEWWPD